jgi:polyisoprenoid-binding protein YceI
MKWRTLLLLSIWPAVAVMAAERPLTVDRSRSSVEVAVKATVDSFTANLPDYQTELILDDATGRITRAQFAFNFWNLKTGKDKRDAKMHEWQDTGSHPQGEFKLLSLQPTSAGHWIAAGELQIHGVTRPVSFPVTITNDRKQYAIDGEAVIDTREHGLPVIRLFGLLKVDPLVTVRFHLQASLKDN